MSGLPRQIEYGLPLGLIAIVTMVAMAALGDSVISLWAYVDTSVAGAMPSSL